MNKNHHLQASTELLDMFANSIQWEQSQSLSKKYFQEELDPDEEQSNFKATQK